MSQIFLSRPLNIFPQRRPAPARQPRCWRGPAEPRDLPRHPQQLLRRRDQVARRGLPPQEAHRVRAPQLGSSRHCSYLFIFILFISNLLRFKKAKIYHCYTQPIYILLRRIQEDWTSIQVCPEGMYNIGNMG